MQQRWLNKLYVIHITSAVYKKYVQYNENWDRYSIYINQNINHIKTNGTHCTKNVTSISLTCHDAILIMRMDTV